MLHQFLVPRATIRFLLYLHDRIRFDRNRITPCPNRVGVGEDGNPTGRTPSAVHLPGPQFVPFRAHCNRSDWVGESSNETSQVDPVAKISGTAYCRIPCNATI